MRYREKGRHWPDSQQQHVLLETPADIWECESISFMLVCVALGGRAVRQACMRQPMLDVFATTSEVGLSPCAGK